MAYSEKYYIVLLNSDTLTPTGLYTVNGDVKVYTSEAEALVDIKDLYGENECRLVQEKDLTWSVST